MEDRCVSCGEVIPEGIMVCANCLRVCNKTNRGKRPPASYRGSSPCDGCTEKFTACHDRCPKDERGEFGYKAWTAKCREIDKKRKEYVESLGRRKRW